MTKRNKAISNILEDIGGRLYDYIAFRVPNAEDAEDVFQDVLLQFTNSFDSIISLERALGWLYTVSKNKITDLFRRQNKYSIEDDIEMQTVIDEIGINPEDEFEMRILEQELRTAINSLPLKQKEIFIQNEIEGKSFRQIAKDNNESINTLLARKHYAVKTLRQQLINSYQEFLEKIR